MKKLLTILLLFMLLGTAQAVYAETPITVNIDSVPVSFDVAPRIIGGRTMVPVRAIFEALGAKVEWEPSTQTVTAEKGIKMISMVIGKKEIAVGDKYILMDAAPMIVENRTLIPARYAAEVFDNTVKWTAETRTVDIISTEQPENFYYKKYHGDEICLMYPADWLFDISYPGTVFIDNQPSSYDELGLGMISISAIDHVSESFSDTVSARYDYLLNDCGYNITEFKATSVNGKNAQLFRYVDAEGDYVLSYFIDGSSKSHYIEFITDSENGFSDIFKNVLSTVEVD